MVRQLLSLLLLGLGGVAIAQPQPEYVKKGTRAETIRAALAAAGLPNLEGDWYYAGPFDNTEGIAFETSYAPEKGFDPNASFTGKDGVKFGWKKFAKAPFNKTNLEALFPRARKDAAVYLYHEFESPKAFKLPISLGSDDTLSVFFNGKNLLNENYQRPAAPDQDIVDLVVKPGKNQLLIKVCQYSGQWEIFINPENSTGLTPTIAKRIDRDFPPAAVQQAQGSSSSAEAKYYKVTTLPQPADCVLEVGGLGLRPDGKLLACTRRGEVWLVHNPNAENPADIKFTRYASGLHEALGLHVVDNKTVYITQRPELTLLMDKNADDQADEFQTISDKWGVSGDYHEFAFGPAVSKTGDFFITLNVGFGGGHQAKAAWRGWCVKIEPSTGKLEPWAYGLRSPNGIAFNPEGELFYADNQGEWVATNKLHHLKKGKFYGHQAGLKWVKDSPFAGKVKDTIKSGMWYDGTDPKNPTAEKVLPEVDPPVIWFPYGRMGQSVSEPIFDTTGKFGPFAGQCFLGDQTRSMVMRVAMEKVNNVYQGACFPFRSGLQCGVNRLAFGTDGSLYVGQTNRGWGSVGGKPYGLQRINFTGEIPFEMHSVKLNPTGFDITFTEPLAEKLDLKADSVSVKSWTYLYNSNYGCPETDTRAENVVRVKATGPKTLRVDCTGLQKGRVYEIRLEGFKNAAGESLLHSEAYYTLNELVPPEKN
jgi:hypothetical protein